MAEDDQDPSLLKSLRERIQSAYDTKELSDCVFSVGEKEVTVKAHKFVMSLSSPVFKAMFHSDLAETGATPIRVTDIEPAGFEGMLQFMYTDSVEFVSTKHAAQVLVAARKYIVPHLITICNEHIIVDSLEMSAALDLCGFAGSNHMEDVSKACVEYLKRNTTLVINDEKFKETDLSVVELLVQQNELNIKSELELFKAVEQWAVRESDKREITLDDLLLELNDVICSFRFKTMSLTDLKSGVLKSSLLSQEEKAALYMNKVESTSFPYPKKFSSCTDVRLQCGSVKQWSLKRSWKNRVLVVINKMYNPFPRKSFTVSRPIKLNGLQLERHSLDVKLISDNWEIGVIETESFKVDFPHPAYLMPGEVYWIEISYEFDVFGDGYYYDDVCTTYRMNNMIIKMSDNYSQIQEMFFEELDEEAALYMNKVECTLFPYPKKFSSCTDVRPQCGSVKQWSLQRSWKNRVLVAINETCNPFPRKSFTVSRPIKLIGLQLERHSLDVKLISDNWKIEVLKTRNYKVDFPQFPNLIPGEVYWIEISYESDFFGDGFYYDDVCTTYRTNSMTIKMSNDYSQIQEMFFEEL